ncbi:hypothetical protein PENFLA_c088G10220 [Penicillium flavigenum]|uniref:Xylanolytic transcriptional activator regulatory domain-containing protein n=1 Tax=Penicillium flavigenum TaxID=254877 RepID=A0A1V6SA11_9EURO|nr:hypothetical protein PENFLA_c088G10220 [Penicillium flavigenum]
MPESERSLGRNSHVPANVDIAKQKLYSLGATQIITENLTFYPVLKNAPDMCTIHLTKVESRLEVLENALGKLFPSGELEEITRSLLADADETPADQKTLIQSFIDTNESILRDAPLESETMLLDNAFDDTHSWYQLNSNYDQLGVGSEEHDSSLGGLFCKDSPANDLAIPPEQEEEFVDTYFSCYHKLYPYVQESTFRSQFQDQLTTCPFWPVLANMILAFGSWLGPGHHSELGIKYYTKAQAHLQKIPLSEEGSIVTVQALLLLSDFAQKQGSPEESWHYVATAVRKSVSFGLHIEPSDPELPALDREIRRRVWWATYCAESCSAKIYGRPLSLPEDGLITIRPVTNTHDQDPVAPASLFPTPTDDPTIYSGLIQQSSYHRMANEIYRRVLSSPNVTPQLDRLCATVAFDSLASSIIVRSNALPAEEHSAEAQCRAAGLTIARNTIGQISEYIEKGTDDKMTLAFTLYALFHALLVPVILIKGNPSSPRSISYIQDIERARLAMEHLSAEDDNLSKSFITVLDRLFAVVRQPKSDDPDRSSVHGEMELQKQYDTQISNKNIFGNEELVLLENAAPKQTSGLDFSEWLRS